MLLFVLSLSMHSRPFVSDEFNLASPAVMNVVAPLLEGRQSVIDPQTGNTIQAHPGFRFFATQNHAIYADRNRLPVSLRNRFLEVQFSEFPQAELAIII